MSRGGQHLVFAPVGANLAAYGLAHAVVDGVCAAMAAYATLGKMGNPLALWFWVVAYDSIAFTLQLPFGYTVDRLNAPRAIAITGCIVTGLAVIICGSSIPVALCVGGIGNALFHAGGGAVSLNATPYRATGPGLFVAPGWLGLTLGGLAASRGHFTPWLFALLPLAACALIIPLHAPATCDSRRITPAKGTGIGLILALMLFAIAIRSLVGLAENFSWKSSMPLLLLLAGAVVAGKALGGILADRFGWKRVAVTALLLSAPLISFGADYPILAVPGMFLFQMVMPITLASVAFVFPGRPGFSFGLASLALIAGAWPTFTLLKPALGNHVLIFVLAVFSAAAVLAGLRRLRRFLPASGVDSATVPWL